MNSLAKLLLIAILSVILLLFPLPISAQYYPYVGPVTFNATSEKATYVVTPPDPNMLFYDVNLIAKIVVLRLRLMVRPVHP